MRDGENLGVDRCWRCGELPAAQLRHTPIRRVMRALSLPGFRGFLVIFFSVSKEVEQDSCNKYEAGARSYGDTNGCAGR